MSLANVRTPAAWDRARLSALVPVGLIVAVAIICIVVAVVTSARLADEVAVQHDEELFINALAGHRERVLREVQSIATSEETVARLRNSDGGWIERNVALTLKDKFNHDYVFVVDANDRIIYPVSASRSTDPAWLNAVRPDLGPILGYLRGRLRPEDAAYMRPEPDQLARSRFNPRHDRRVQSFMNRLAVVAGALIAPSDHDLVDGGEPAPIVVSVKLIDEGVMADIAARLDLPNLHKLDAQRSAPGEHVLNLTDGRGKIFARFAWTPKQRSEEIVKSVVPFIIVALGALASSPVLRCATCGVPRPGSSRESGSCGILRCMTRCRGCRTGAISASGWKP